MDGIGGQDEQRSVAVARDPFADEWADEAFRAAREEWLAELAADHVDDVADPPESHDVASALYDLETDELAAVARSGRALIADQYARIGRILTDAAAIPEPWVGADPTRDPQWRDPRGRSVAVVRRERAEIAVRAAVLDIAVRLRLSESAVRSRAAYADVLRERTPIVWSAFLAGDIGEPQAQTTARLAATLPADDAEAWAAFDQRVAPAAMTSAPAKFAASARTARESVHPRSLGERHASATEGRGVWIDPELDGMARLEALLPADRASAAYARVDAVARELHGREDETRSLAQVRADVLAAMLTHELDAEGRIVGAGVATAVAITVPALTLLGRGDEPAVLDGYGPIDLDTARRLAGGAASWVRILTHPVSGVPISLDRTAYRVPAALRRWLGVVHPTCTAPGCLRSARHSDMDHRVEWRHGGRTDAANLGPLCPPHHRIKTESLWRLHPKPDGEWQWISPTGHRSDLDPPPF